jgi:hypothetical protein
MGILKHINNDDAEDVKEGIWHVVGSDLSFAVEQLGHDSLSVDSGSRPYDHSRRIVTVTTIHTASAPRKRHSEMRCASR